MPDYRSMYTMLFNAMTDAIALLQQAQQKAEEMYMAEAEGDDLSPGEEE